MAEQEIKPDAPAHVPGASRGEERIEKEGKEPGRDAEQGRTARDATSINPDAEDPIDPKMPHLPPA